MVSDQGTTLGVCDLHNAWATILIPFNHAPQLGDNIFWWLLSSIAISMLCWQQVCKNIILLLVKYGQIWSVYDILILGHSWSVGLVICIFELPTDLTLGECFFILSNISRNKMMTDGSRQCTEIIVSTWLKYVTLTAGIVLVDSQNEWKYINVLSMKFDWKTRLYKNGEIFSFIIGEWYGFRLKHLIDSTDMFLLVIFITCTVVVSHCESTEAKFELGSPDVSLNCIPISSRSSVECALRASQIALYGNQFAYRDGQCHVCRADNVNCAVSEAEYLLAGPHHVRGGFIVNIRYVT